MLHYDELQQKIEAILLSQQSVTIHHLLFFCCSSILDKKLNSSSADIFINKYADLCKVPFSGGNKGMLQSPLLPFLVPKEDTVKADGMPPTGKME